MSDKPEKQSLRERFAVEVMGWERIVVEYSDGTSSVPAFKSPETPHRFIGEHQLPPWDTDDGLAIKVLREWCGEQAASAEILLDEDSATVRIHLPIDSNEAQEYHAEHKSLATAICGAMIAAKEGMEEK